MNPWTVGERRTPSRQCVLRRMLLLLFFSCPTAIVVKAAAADNVEQRKAHIARTTSSPVIDGILDDSLWKDAEVLTDFVQRIPYSDVPASDATEIRLLRDDRNIYTANSQILLESERNLQAAFFTQRGKPLG